MSVLIEGPAGAGKTFLARRILDAIPAGAAKAVVLAGERGRRNDPFGAARPLLAGWPADGDPGEAALLRRLAWASQSLPLAVRVTTRPYPSRAPLRALVEQARVRLWLPPMGPMMLGRLVDDRMGRWPGSVLRRILAMAAGNPLFAAELLRTYQSAGALAESDQDMIEARFELDLRGTGVEEMIWVQVGQLDDPARDVLADGSMGDRHRPWRSGQPG